MTGCEIVVVLTLAYRDGSAYALHARPVVPKRCHATVVFRASPPVRRMLLMCPIRPS